MSCLIVDGHVCDAGLWSERDQSGGKVIMLSTLYRAALSSSVLLAAMALLAPNSATAAEPFYKGKTIKLYVAAGAGGSYGPYAQLTAEHLPRHLPENPTVVVHYLPGAGGAKAANYLYNVAPKDGTAIGILLKYIVVNKVLNRKGLRYDPAKFNWLVSAGPINSVLHIWGQAPATSLEGARKTVLVVGSTGKSSETFITPTLMNALLGTRFKVVTGYKGMPSLATAMVRGEINGRASSWDGVKSSKPDWVRDKKIALIAQSGLEKNDDLQDVPRLVDLARNDADRQLFEFFGSGSTLGRIYVAPPGVPQDRVKILSDGLAALFRDPAFLKDAEKRKLVVSVKGSDAVKALVAKTLDTPTEIIERAKEILGK
tara:strand:- start:637 stop:1749 length:1113 start_codon:yes stop_codon:yes gene_type:complete